MRSWIYFGLLTLFSLPVTATELVHRFENPNFGGSPLNGSVLLGEATAQNGFKEAVVVKPPTTPTPQKSQIELFKDNLQRAILNKVSTNTVNNLFDDNGNIKPNSNLNFDINGDGQSDFSVVVGGAVNDNVSISISDGITETVLVVPYVPTAVATPATSTNTTTP
jgi:curli production assembly/transport component CsgF